jgi:hypothetical protein
VQLQVELVQVVYVYSTLAHGVELENEREAHTVSPCAGYLDPVIAIELDHP